MADYLLMLLEDEQAQEREPPKSTATLIEQQAEYTDRIRRTGKLKDSGRLRPSREGQRVRRHGDHVSVQEGPFDEQGRSLGAYLWVQADGIDAAARLAAECPTHASDEIDVRPVMKGNIEGDKEGKPGKIFAFGVLGHATTEGAWVEIMNRIDAESQGRPQAAGFIGGVRLEAPKSGRRVVSEAGRRAIFDGPFLESKEVIGGVFLVRMTSMDTAIAWASESPFVAHGALEIRELWRI